MHDAAVLEQLTDDIGIARQLLELIDQEFAALGDRNLVELEATLSKKQPLLALLGQHSAQRSQWLVDQRLSPDRAGLEIAASRIEQGEALLEQAKLLETERNGRLIRANQSTLGEMLKILQGKDDTPSLYDNRGSAAKNKQQRPLSQA